MMRRSKWNAAIAVLFACVLPAPHAGAAGSEQAGIGRIVARTIGPVMQRYGIPGMAVGLVVDGRAYVFDYGVASRATRKPVTSSTLFEIGSISKTFTATLASYAKLSGKLSLSEMASTDLPSLRGSSFDKVSLLNLGTHTSGGLPLQVPAGVTNDAQLTAYLRSWKPTYAPGTYRIYSNPSIGLLGAIAAKRMNAPFVTLEGALFRALGLTHTYLDVPESQLASYAQGYTASDAPIRMKPGELAAETYGIHTTAGDLARFLEANLGLLDLDQRTQRALTQTHIGYYLVGAMTQDLVWEQYRYPVSLTQLLAGNSAKVVFEPNPVTRIDPPLSPQNDVLLNKTGSTNGFGAYVAFVPERKIGIVLLANKSYPIAARVTAAYAILTQLDRSASHTSR